MADSVPGAAGPDINAQLQSALNQVLRLKQQITDLQAKLKKVPNFGDQDWDALARMGFTSATIALLAEYTSKDFTKDT